MGEAGHSPMAGTPIQVELRVLEAHPNPHYTSHRDRWTVRCEVLRVLSGSFPAGLTSLTLLLHSPTRSFATDVTELPRYVFSVELEEPITDPYSGELTVLTWRRVDPHQ